MDVKTLCLGVLSLGDASGYEIRKMFEEGPFTHFHQASFGSIYPALSKLLEDGHVTCTVEAQDGRPDKKVYAMTKTGLQTFRKALTKSPEMDRVRSETLFMLFFADHLEDQHLVEIYDGYAAHYQFFVDKMHAMDSTGWSRGRTLVRGFGLAFYGGVLKFMKDKRDEFLNAPKGQGWRDLASIRECMELGNHSDPIKPSKQKDGGQK